MLVYIVGALFIVPTMVRFVGDVFNNLRVSMIAVYMAAYAFLVSILVWLIYGDGELVIMMGTQLFVLSYFHENMEKRILHPDE